ncbi:MAG: hypothetical protein Q4G33_11235, partial [bacterium]|nr:hypothetical protein [bacterium]
NGSTSKSSGGSVSNGSSPANGSGSTSSGSSTAITGGGSANGYSELVPIEEYNLPSAEKKQSIDLPNSADSFGKSENTDDSGILKRAAPKASEERVVLSMNTGAYAAAYSAAMPASVPFASEIGYAEWSYRDYFDYLGRMLSPALPSDFKLTEHDSVSITDEAFLSETFEMAVDEYGTPVFDNRIFVFDGSDGRYAGIQTSKDTSTAMTYLTDSNFTLSTIGSSYGVLIGTIEDCRAYMVCGNVSYVINAVGLNEDELKALLLSAAEG